MGDAGLVAATQGSVPTKMQGAGVPGARCSLWRAMNSSLDERMAIPWEELSRTVGLDTEQWQVIGFEISGGEHADQLRVVATPRDVWE